MTANQTSAQYMKDLNKPYVRQEFPVVMYAQDASGATALAHDPDQESEHASRGWKRTAPPKPMSASIDVTMQPSTISEKTALGEQARKFDAAYAELLGKYNELKSANADLQEQYDTLVEKSTAPVKPAQVQQPQMAKSGIQFAPEPEVKK